MLGYVKMNLFFIQFLFTIKSELFKTIENKTEGIKPYYFYKNVDENIEEMIDLYENDFDSFKLNYINNNK